MIKCDRCYWKNEMKKHLRENFFYGLNRIYVNECEHCISNPKPVVKFEDNYKEMNINGKE